MAVDPDDTPPDGPDGPDRDDPDDGDPARGDARPGPDGARPKRRAVVGWVVHEVGLLPLLLGPAAVTVLAATVGTGGLVDAFVSSAVFATGVAAFVAVLRTRAFGRVSGWPLVVLAGSWLLGGVLLASLVHMAAFSSLPGSTTATGTPVDLPVMVATAALVSWGWAGAVVSAVSGVLAGVWGVRFVAEVD